MSSIHMPVDQILSLLAAGPAQIARDTAGLRQAQLHAAPGPGEWSVRDVLAHLRACADVWGQCIMTLLEQDQPTIRAVNPRTWIERTGYPDQPFEPSLQAFTAQRAELLAALTPLTPAQWARSATVTGAGKTLVRTVHFYAGWMASHERPHLKQIRRAAIRLQPSSGAGISPSLG